jgi:hypothetical protein
MVKFCDGVRDMLVFIAEESLNRRKIDPHKSNDFTCSQRLHERFAYLLNRFQVRQIGLTARFSDFRN